MILDSLHLFNFKNYPEASIQFCEGVNCFTGLNGSGKTNLLDAIHYLAMTKSYFSSTDSTSIRSGEDYMIVKGEFLDGNIPETISCTVRTGHKKIFRRNENEYDRLSEHIGLIPAVMMAPNDQELISGGSEQRRKFIDSLISQYEPAYLDHLIRYNGVLSQRNALLKQFAATGFADWNNMTIWDEMLIQHGIALFEYRKKYIIELAEVFNNIYGFICDGHEKPVIGYESKLTDCSFADLLFNSRNKDFHQEYSTAGIHRDDLDFSIEGMAVRKFASQGQQKSFVLALKLAQFELLGRYSKSKPIVLLDDIFDKLDDQRVSKLIDHVCSGRYGQVFISHTSAHKLAEIFDSRNIINRIFHVAGGSVHPHNN